MYSSGQPSGQNTTTSSPGIHQVFHRFGESSDDAIDFREEGFGEKGDFQRRGLI
jgi:hypothetical protein